MARIVTVVLKRDGSLHVASDKISLADAERWADEGYSVFLIATQDRRWAINQLPSGKIFTDETRLDLGEETNAKDEFPQLTYRGE